MADVVHARGGGEENPTLPRDWRIIVAVLLFAVLAAGLAAVAPRDDEPSAIGLEMAGDAATFEQVLAGVGPSIWGSSPPPVAKKDQRERDDDGDQERAHDKWDRHRRRDGWYIGISSTTPVADSIPTPRPTCTTYRSQEDCKEAVDAARSAVHWDFAFIAAYLIWAFGLCWLGAKHVRPDRRALLFAAQVAVGLAAVADVTEDYCLLRALHANASGTWARAATSAATVKWALVPVFIAGAIYGLWAWLRDPAKQLAPAGRYLDRTQRWMQPSLPGAPGEEAKGAWEFDKSGICFSGGGIRSGSFCLGVMQQLEAGDGKGSAFAKARYLAAVSGGGYTAGAAQLHASLEQSRRIEEARAAHGNDSAAADTAEDEVRAQAAPAPFSPGSPEEDHLRRHGNYLADTAGEWFSAIAQALGKLLANLALVALLVIALSQVLGWIGRLLLGAKPEAVAPAGNWPHLPVTLVLALAGMALPALILAAARRHSPGASATEAEKQRGRVTTGLATSLAIALGAGAAVLATTAFVLPLLNGLGRHMAGLIGHPKGVAAAGWPTVLLTAVLGRVVTKAMKREATGGTAPADPKAVLATKKPRPNLFFAKNLVELVAGPVIVLVLVGYLTALAAQGRQDGPIGVVKRFGGVEVRDWHIAVGAAAIFFAVVLTVDAVNWSMHRFYKRRLWSALTYDKQELDQRDWCNTPKLSEHGAPLEGRPELVLCGAAQVSGPILAPPGHRAVTWTFGHDWVGGPEIGWCETKTMEDELISHHRGGDVSMFGAVAISGAAFGSAMGRQSKGSLNSVFALSNARLGVWLPNPARLGRVAPELGAWTYKPHNLVYLWREIFGRYSPNARWILVSDGGHYDNLGLVELFRRRCTRIVCIDASGDASGAVSTVAEALRNAELELGVTVTVPATDVVSEEVARQLAVVADVAAQLEVPIEVAQQLIADAAERLGITAEVAEVLGVVAEVGEVLGLSVEVSKQLIVNAGKQLATTHDASPWDVAPGGGELGGSTEALADALKHRLARKPIVRGTIHYPPEAGLGKGKKGHLIIGRAVLDPEAPWPVLSHAVGSDSFPNDPTGDQWFNADQFDNYVMLGRYLGTRLLAEMQNIGWYL